MEITKGRSGTVNFIVPTNLTTASYQIFKDGEVYGTTKTVTPNNGIVAADIPYSLTSEEGQIEVVLTFTYNDTFVSKTYSKSQWVDVVNPILEEFEIKEIHPNATADEIERIEKATRHIINSHTGQQFSLYHGTYDVRGNDAQSLRLPRRFLQLETINDIDVAPALYDIVDNGWTLIYYPWGEPPVPPLKADYHGLHYTTNGVISNPENIKVSGWSSDYVYRITGTWGWVEVPPQVREAAKLLVNDYACADQTYRDRYLTSMTAADWRIQFNSGAFAQTGNVRADHLLNDYITVSGWAVV